MIGLSRGVCHVTMRDSVSRPRYAQRHTLG